MRLLIISDSPFAISAYSQQAWALAHALHNVGHTVIYYGVTHPAAPMLHEGIQVVGNLSYGQGGQVRDLVAYYVETYAVDAVLSFKDPFVLDYERLARLPVAWLAFAPSDTEPAAHMLIQSVQHATRVITPTRFSVGQFAQHGVKADYAPHGVDTDFWQDTPSLRRKFRKANGISDNAFMACMVATNQDYPSRKSLDQALIAFIGFASQHQDAVLWLHTDILGTRGGVNLEHILLTFDAQERMVRFTDPAHYEAGCSQEWLRELYCASDVLLAPSEGEGFCVPVIEAAACGTPAIVTDFTAFREVHKTGWRIRKGEAYWSPIGGLRFRPSRDGIAEALQAAYSVTPEKRAELRTDARKSSLRYNTNEVMKDFWLPLMREIEGQILEAELV